MIDLTTHQKVNAKVAAARRVQAGWSAVPIAKRVQMVRSFRRLLAHEAEAVTSLIPATLPRSRAETLSAEILPLAEACRFLERQAARLLRPHRLTRFGGPIWLFGVTAEIRRDPFGVILVLGPGNYPLFLPGVQMVQALVAGNAAIVKPAPGCGALTQAIRDLLVRGGCPADLVAVLDEDVASAEAALQSDIDKVILTGSADTGRAVLRQLADNLVPAVMELSGNDAVLVLPGADLPGVADALAFGLRFNGSQTCLAPRRVFATRPDYDRLVEELSTRIMALPSLPMPPGRSDALQDMIREAEAAGAAIIGTAGSAIAVANPPRSSPLLTRDLFAPILSLVPVETVDEAIGLAGEGPYALGASVFGPEAQATAAAARLQVGSVCINDVVAPTADPRLPFGGRRQSGFGSTRGAEGLLEMTTIKTVSVHHGKLRPHFEPLRDGDDRLFAAYIRAAHGGGWRDRGAAVMELLRRARQRYR